MLERKDLERVILAITMYKMLNQKYNLEFIEAEYFVSQLRRDVFPG